MEVLSLLKNEARCLDSLLVCSTAILSTLESNGEVDLSKYDQDRLVCFKTLELINHELTQAAQKLNRNIDTLLKADLQEAVQKREALVQKIISMDSKIMTLLEQKLEETKVELHGARKGREVLSKFKSSWVPKLGSEMDSQL